MIKEAIAKVVKGEDLDDVMMTKVMDEIMEGGDRCTEGIFPYRHEHERGNYRRNHICSQSNEKSL